MQNPKSETTGWRLFWTVIAETFAAGIVYDFGKAVVERLMQ